MKVIPIVLLAACASETDLPTRLAQNFSVQGSPNEEELIGDAMYGTSVFTVSTEGGERAKYMIRISPSPGLNRERMFWNETPQGKHRWGWFSTNDTPCIASSTEDHDITVGGGGGGAAPPTGLARQGVRLRNGTCGPRPPSGARRQAWLSWVFDGGAVPERCSYTVSVPDLGGLEFDGGASGAQRR